MNGFVLVHQHSGQTSLPASNSDGVSAWLAALDTKMEAHVPRTKRSRRAVHLATFVSLTHLRFDAYSCRVAAFPRSAASICTVTPKRSFLMMTAKRSIVL